jgi:putative transposase
MTGSRKGEKHSNRYRVQAKKVGKVHCQIADARRDYAHKVSSEIVRKADVIALEDLNIKGMMANGKLSKAMADGSFRMLRTQIEYKASGYGRQIMLADRFAPTSKTCSCCGYKMAELPLSVREWDCPQCGEHHDRDMNAARNILAFAIGSGRSEGAYPHVRGGVNPRREAVSAVSPMDSDEPQTTHLEPTKVLPNEARMRSAA